MRICCSSRHVASGTKRQSRTHTGSPKGGLDDSQQGGSRARLCGARSALSGSGLARDPGLWHSGDGGLEPSGRGPVTSALRAASARAARRGGIALRSLRGRIGDFLALGDDLCTGANCADATSTQTQTHPLTHRSSKIVFHASIRIQGRNARDENVAPERPPITENTPRVVLSCARVSWDTARTSTWRPTTHSRTPPTGSTAGRPPCLPACRPPEPGGAAKLSASRDFGA